VKITTTYRGNTVEVVDASSFTFCLEHSVFIQTKWQGNKKTYIAEIQAGELLTMARECCKKLTQISGVNFAICHEVMQEWVEVKK